MQVAVTIRPEGGGVYLVLLVVTGQRPLELRRIEATDGSREAVRAARREAEQYRDGVADGVHYAAEMLQRLAGHASAFDAR